jgi:predicted RND superfamily exporter protein
MVVRRRKSTLIIFLLIIIAAGGIGSLAFSKLDSGGYSNPKSESARAAKYLTSHFHVKDPGIVLIVDSGTTPVSDPSVAASATRLETAVKQVPGVAKTQLAMLPPSSLVTGKRPIFSSLRRTQILGPRVMSAKSFKANSMGNSNHSMYTRPELVL